MLIRLRNKNNDLVIKDVLDIDFNMSVKERDRKYYVKVNRSYTLDEEFLNKKDAEDRMVSIADARNQLEADLRIYY